MTIAEIRGKISHTGRNLHDQMEDLLTSDVFTVCKYVRPQTLLNPFLGTSRSLDDRSLADLLPTSILRADYHFWPMLTSSEPDLLIVLDDDQKQIYLIMIEAKYFSGKSGDPLSDEKFQIAEAPTDQLAREYEDLKSAEDHLDIDPSQIVFRALVYVTRHRSLPNEALSASTNEIKRFFSEDPVELYWTSWFEIAPILKSSKSILDWEQPILEDLMSLIERKRFIKFNGISNLLANKKMESGSVYTSSSVHEKGEYQFNVEPVDLQTQPVYFASNRSTRAYDWCVEDQTIRKPIYYKGMP